MKGVWQIGSVRLVSKPVDVGSLKIGQYVIIDEEPCRIVEYEKSKPGKHGAAKARIVGISVFTGQKKSLISPVDAKTEVPMIDKRTGQLISISGDTVQVMDMENYEPFETPMPTDQELRASLSAGIEVGYGDVRGRGGIIPRKGR